MLTVNARVHGSHPDQRKGSKGHRLSAVTRSRGPLKVV